MEFKRPFGDEARQVADARQCDLFCGEETPTVQAAAKECDINEIVRRFGITAELPPSQFPASYGDFSSIGSYHLAMTSVVEAQQLFGQLPASVRDRFRNDPGELLDALASAGEQEELRAELTKLGVLRAPEAPAAPVRVEVVPVVPPPVVPAS